MRICEFCFHFGQDGSCGLGLKLPNGLSCREFSPTLEKFCADSKDFVNQKQLVEMATFFGIKGSELKKVKLMATQAESSRVQPPDSPEAELPPDDLYSPYASFSLRK
jgi:hypothetical protein